MATGVNVSKLVSYAVLAPPTGVNVSKLVSYAVLATSDVSAPVWPVFAMSMGYMGNPYTSTWSIASGAPPVTYSLVSGALPDGLALSDIGTVGGQITGIPTALGTFSFTLRATNVYGTADRAFSITVGEPILISGSGWITFF